MTTSSLFKASLLALAASAACVANAADIKLGVAEALSGGAAQYGIAIRNGFQLAADEINAAGGVNGRKLQLIIRDDNATPGDAVRAAAGRRPAQPARLAGDQDMSELISPDLRARLSASEAESKDRDDKFKAAIRDPNPVIFLENEILYGQSFPVPKLDNYVVPLGKARIARAGTDVTALPSVLPLRVVLADVGDLDVAL